MSTDLILASKFHKVFLAFVFTCLLTQLQGQPDPCTLACKEAHISVDENCGARLTLDMFLNGEETSCPETVGFEIIIQDYHINHVVFQAVFPSNGVGVYWMEAGGHVGKHFKITIREFDEEPEGPLNSCWNYALVEDKLPPEIICPPDITVSCCDIPDYAPDAVDDCSGVDSIRFVDQQVFINDCNLFGLDTLKLIRRVFIATDKSGNDSDPCEVEIAVIRLNQNIDPDDQSLDIPGLHRPPDLTIYCADFDDLDEDGDGYPDASPQGAGIPWIDKPFDLPDVSIYPLGSGNEESGKLLKYCGIGATFEDLDIVQFDCKRKIMRMWSIREWFCSEESTYNFNQFIIIVDTVGPDIQVPHDFTASTNGYTCEANIYLPGAGAIDECNDVSHVDIRVTNYFDEEITPLLYIPNFKGGYINLPEGHNEIEFIAYDECHNSSSESMFVWVEDHTQPVVVCDQHTVINLTLDGEADLPAHVLDDGSYDDCGLKRFLVQRMVPGCGCEEGYPIFDGMHYLGEFDGHHYYISHDSLPGHKAFKMAAAMGGYVAVIDSLEEDEWIFDAVLDKLGHAGYWIGLSDKNHEGYFEWQNGTDLDYENWGEDQPDNINNQDFVVVNGDESGTWVDTWGYVERRYVLEIENPCGWTELTKLCCADLNTTTMVQFRAIDKWGNYNDCMVEVKAQDKIPPKIFCPPDLTIACEFDFDGLDVFGKVVENQELRESIIIPPPYLLGADTDNGIISPGDPDFPPPLWDGYAFDNCDMIVIEEAPIDERNQCGLGVLIRNFMAYVDGGADTVRCSQRLTFESITEFSPDNITFPPDTTIEACVDIDDIGELLNPQFFGSPKFDEEDECDLVGISYKDEVVDIGNGILTGCFKVIRVWKVIDWCDISNSRNQGDPIVFLDTYEQEIRIENHIDPEFSECFDREPICSFELNCGAAFIELTKDGDDDCTDTDSLNWEVKIDLDSDGDQDFFYFEDGEKVFFEFDSEQRGEEADASGFYPVGTHTVTWILEDHCGNKSVCEEEFTIMNCKPATPYCYDAITVSLDTFDLDNDMMPDTAYKEITTDFLDAGSSHPCGYEVLLSFSPDLDSTSRVFTCEDVANSPLMVELYASVITEEGDMIQAWCVVDVTVEDTLGFCGAMINTEAKVSGLLFTETNGRLEGADVELNGSEFESVQSNSEGEYAFPLMLAGGTYQVIPSKNDDPGNGVSTLDMVLMHQHIMGVKTLETPYKIIAADINKDQKVTALDLVEMRKLILGLEDEFGNNDSWRFVDAEYSFGHSVNPLIEDFPEKYDIDRLSENIYADFMAIKVGDVNNSAKVNGSPNTEIRNQTETMSLQIPEIPEKYASFMEVPVIAGKQTRITGFQLTLNFDSDKLTFREIREGMLGMNKENLGMNRLDQGLIPMSWHQSQVAHIEEGETLFTLIFEGEIDRVNRGLINVSSEITIAEAYNGVYEILPVEMSVKDQSSGVDQYQLYQNRPNPFNDITEIGFYLPVNTEAKFNVYNATGQILMQIQEFYTKGYHEVRLNRKEFPASGVLYYTLETEEFTATKRMIVLD